MGGNALNKYGIITDRKSTEDFYRISDILRKKIEQDLNVETFVPFFYREKESHGDIDLLIKMDSKYINSKIDIRDYIKKTFNVEHINSNGGVYSFAYENFQIDFIPMKELYWETSKIYFSWDPLNNIIGKTFHKFGLSWGWDGLKYKYRNFNGIVDEDILISTDIKKILDFGGYDYERYLLGFNSLEEIFNYIIDSKYFNSDTFQMDSLTRIDRKRNKRRKTYKQFLSYINEKNIIKNYIFNENKNDYLILINDYFKESNLIETIKYLNSKNNINKIISDKFNGDLIMNIHNDLKGVELGKAINLFKNSFDKNEDYTDFIIKNDFETIMRKFNAINKL